MTKIREVDEKVYQAILDLGENAYGASIHGKIQEKSRVSYSSVYHSMDRLERLGIIETWCGNTSPERGNHPKRMARIKESRCLTTNT